MSKEMKTFMTPFLPNGPCGRPIRRWPGRHRGSRPVAAMSLSSGGAVSGTATGGPNSPGVPSGFCATADCTNVKAAWIRSSSQA